MSMTINMGTQVVRPTVQSVPAGCARAREFSERHHLCLDATIEDYSIGRRERARCRLQVEWAKRNGYRTVRTTTNKDGRWCKPRNSTFRNEVTVVVDDLYGEPSCPGPDRSTAWLAVGERAVYLHYPNGDEFHLVCLGQAGGSGGSFQGLVPASRVDK